MAACTFAQRVAIELALLVPSQALIDQSLGPGPGTAENTNRTAAFARMGVARWNAVMGSPGAFDDATPPTEGTTQEMALEWAVRWSWLHYRRTFKALPPDLNPADDPDKLLAELESYRAGAIQEAATPVVVETEDDPNTEDDE